MEKSGGRLPARTNGPWTLDSSNRSSRSWSFVSAGTGNPSSRTCVSGDFASVKSVVLPRVGAGTSMSIEVTDVSWKLSSYSRSSRRPTNPAAMDETPRAER